MSRSRPVTLSKTEAEVTLTGGMNPLSDISAGIKITWEAAARRPGILSSFVLRSLRSADFHV